MKQLEFMLVGVGGFISLHGCRSVKRTSMGLSTTFMNPSALLPVETFASALRQNNRHMHHVVITGIYV